MLIRKIGGSQGRNLRLQVSALPAGRDPQTAAVKHPEGPEEHLYTPGRVEADIFHGRNWRESWEGRTPNRDGVIFCSRKMLDLFDDTVRLGHIPAWFDNLWRAAHTTPMGEALVA